jgi:hypothetical protein
MGTPVSGAPHSHPMGEAGDVNSMLRQTHIHDNLPNAPVTGATRSTQPPPYNPHTSFGLSMFSELQAHYTDDSKRQSVDSLAHTAVASVITQLQSKVQTLFRPQ